MKRTSKGTVKTAATGSVRGRKNEGIIMKK